MLVQFGLEKEAKTSTIVKLSDFTQKNNGHSLYVNLKQYHDIRPMHDIIIDTCPRGSDLEDLILFLCEINAPSTLQFMFTRYGAEIDLSSLCYKRKYACPNHSPLGTIALSANREQAFQPVLEYVLLNLPGRILDTNIEHLRENFLPLPENLRTLLSERHRISNLNHQLITRAEIAKSEATLNGVDISDNFNVIRENLIKQATENSFNPDIFKNSDVLEQNHLENVAQTPIRRLSFTQ